MYSIIIILIIMLLLLTAVHVKEAFTDTPKRPYTETPKYVHQDLLYILKHTDAILNQNNQGLSKIPYFIDGGTMLGQIRHKSFIPWDDDCDICIPNSYIKNFLQRRNLFKKVGLRIDQWWGGYKISRINGIKSINGDWSFPFCDVFPLIEIEPGVLHYQSAKARKIWPSSYYLQSEIYPLQRVKFEDITLNTIYNPYTYLDRCFGKNWATEAFQQYDHESEKPLPKIKFLLKDYMEMPYLPLKIPADQIPTSKYYQTCLNDKVCLT